MTNQSVKDLLRDGFNQPAVLHHETGVGNLVKNRQYIGPSPNKTKQNSSFIAQVDSPQDIVIIQNEAEELFPSFSVICGFIQETLSNEHMILQPFSNSQIHPSSIALEASIRIGLKSFEARPRTVYPSLSSISTSAPCLIRRRATCQSNKNN